MTALAPAKNSGATLRPLMALGILAAATAACLIPWINKAFCIDDPLFLWAAAQIQAHPLDFYGCDVNWYSTQQPLYDVMKNPPLACYYLAGTAAIVGWSEPALHAVYLLPALGAIAGTWFVARSLCGQPVSAALIALVTPAYLVSSSNLMCDTMMVGLWTWAIGLWVAGMKSSKRRWLAAASLLIAVAALTKYFAICLIPLLAVYTVLRQPKKPWPIAWLLVPIALLAGYQLWTSRQYGRGLLSDAARFAWGIAAAPGPGQTFAQETVASKILVALSFTGGSFLPVLFCAPWLWSKRDLAVATILGLATAAYARWQLSAEQLASLHMPGPFTSLAAAQLGLFTACGVLVLWLALRDLGNNLSADACLLTLWVLGTFVFAGFVNWTCNVRSLLPIAPAFAMLVVRRLELAPGRTPRTQDWRWSLVPSLAIALTVLWADYRLANSARTAAGQISEVVKSERGAHWFQGHWGFQYYMRAMEGCEVDLRNRQSFPGEVVVTPSNNTDVFFFEPSFMEALDELDFRTCPWLTTMHGQVGAGFYSSIWGPMPFVFGPVPVEKYRIWRLKLDSSPQLPQQVRKT